MPCRRGNTRVSVAQALTSPLPWAVFGTAVVAIAWRRLPCVLRWAGVVLLVALVFAMTPFGAGLLQESLVRQVPPPSACTAPLPTTIVLLGGGSDGTAASASDFDTLALTSVRRAFAAVDLWKHTPGAHLVIAGGGRPVSEAVLLAALAEQMGVPSTAITTEMRSRTTWENAGNVAALAPVVPRRVWLVTAPMHMPRSLRAFRAFGFAPCAYAAGPRPARGRRFDDFIPQARGLQRAEYALHEWAGIAEYRWMAWRHAKAQRL